MATRQAHLLGQVSDFDLRLIRVYRAVVESGGFSAAEVALGISRSAISTHMADLEARIGLKLCQRGPAGFTLTEEGKHVYELAIQLLATVETFRTEVNALHKQLRGELNIGITDNLVTLPHMRITHALAALKDRGPEVRINIHMIPPGEVEMGVLDGRLHVGVVPAVSSLAGLKYRALYGETAYLYCARGHPLFDRRDETVTEAELGGFDAVIPSYPLPAEALRRCRVLNGTASATDREGIAFLVFTERYIGYLPEHYAERWVGEGRLRAILPREYRYTVNYATVIRRGRRSHLVLQTFLEQLENT